jgi:hypothetical protein
MLFASGPADEAADFGLLSAASVRQFNGLDIAASSDLALEIAYYKDLSLVEWRYDSDSRDGIPSIEWATDNFVLDGGNRPHIAVSYFVGERGHVEGAFSHFRLASIVAGDFNHDQAFDKWDANLLMESIRSGEVDLRRDLNNDSAVDLSDLDFWVHDLKNTYYGDANLDGEFNTGDLVRVFQFAEYEDSLADNSTWETGDWNADGDFTTSDLVRAFQDAGFEKGPRKNTMTVPEPAGRVLLLVAATGILIGRRTIGSLPKGVFVSK